MLGATAVEHQVCLYSQDEKISGRRFKETHLDRHSRPPWSQRNSHLDHQGRHLCPRGPETYSYGDKHFNGQRKQTKKTRLRVDEVLLKVENTLFKTLFLLRGSMRCPKA